MHPLLGLLSLFWVVVGSTLVLAILRRHRGWVRQRALHFVVLAAPTVALGLGIGTLHHFAGRVCFVGAPPWDYRLGIALPLAMGLIALGALGLGLIRLVVMRRVVMERGLPPPPGLVAQTHILAQEMGTRPPRLLMVAAGRPLAFTCGPLRPTVLLSTWMVNHLDEHELESVLAHELGHVRRRDYLVIWLATVLRDAFCYLPTSWAAYRQVQREKETACDDLAVHTTGRPLALASALAKVWQHSVSGPATPLAQTLTAAGEAIEGRITRLLDAPRPSGGWSRSQGAALGVGAAAFGALLLVQAVNLVVLFSPMGCSPAGPLCQLV